MGQDTPNWDDIPSLDDLKVDWNFEPENPMGKRSYARLTSEDLCQLLDVVNIPVRLVTEQRQTNALLLNISQGGVSLLTKSGEYTDAQLVRMGFFLGKQKVITKGRIRNIRQEKRGIILGIEFVGLPDTSHDFISGMYASLKTKG